MSFDSQAEAAALIVRASDSGRTATEQAAMEEYRRRMASPHAEVRESAAEFLEIARKAGGRR